MENTIEQNPQDVIEALFRYDLLQKESSINNPESLVTIDSIWMLFVAAEKKLEGMQINHTKEMNEVQKYVDNVRTLSEERDHLHSEFEQENEKLKLQLKEIQEKSEQEVDEICNMCKQEGLDELVGSSFSEQMAYLLVVRSTLLDEVEALQEQLQEENQKYNKASDQLKSFVSEENELQQRMTGAMAEMGGMASKLTEALQERDQLKQEVADLTAALNGIKTLPSVVEAKADSVAHMKDLEMQRDYYTQENEKLKEAADKAREQEQCSRLELTVHIEELQEMNKNLKEVNFQLNEQLSGFISGKPEIEEDRSDVVANSQKIIEEMQCALTEEEKQKQIYEGKIQSLKDRVSQLEKSATDSNQFSQHQAQLSEVRRQYDDQCHELKHLREIVTGYERELGLRDKAGNSWKEQHETQLRIATDLQDRNAILEAELTKVWTQLKETLEKLNESERERGILQLRIKDQDDGLMKNERYENSIEEINKLRLKVDELKEKLFEETSGTEHNTKIIQIETELKFTKEQLEQESDARRELEVELEKSRRDLNKTRGGEDEMRQMISELQKRALNAEAQILLVSGERDQNNTEKLVAELNRTQLEDAIELLHSRMEIFAAQSRNYADRYKNLKSKHKSKIRRIRELFFLERRSTTEEIEDLERRLASAEESLGRELAWKEEASNDVQRSEEEKREAINAADEAFKQLEQNREKISELSHVTDELDVRNHKLQNQLSLLQKQKQELSKIVEANKQQQKEELNTLLSSLNMSGSLPYMGQGSLGESAGNYSPESGAVSFVSPMLENPSFDLGSKNTIRGGDSPKQKRSSPYLNLTDTTSQTYAFKNV